MNRFLMLVFFVAISKIAFAQKDSLAFDDHGKYIYYKVEANAQTADTLYNRALVFFKQSRDIRFTLSAEAKDVSIAGSGIFVVYKTSLASHPDGQITYQLKLEIKDGKYRYWLKGFVYTPYRRDRFNNYAPQEGVEIPLESSLNYFPAKELNDILNQTGLFSRQLGIRLKQYLAASVVVKKDTAKKVIHLEKW